MEKLVKKSVKYGLYSAAGTVLVVALGMISTAVCSPKAPKEDNRYVSSQLIMTTAGVDYMFDSSSSEEDWYASIIADSDKLLAGNKEENEEQISKEDLDEMNSLLEDDEKADDDLVVKELLYPELEGIAVAKVDSYLKIRKEPSTDSQILGKLYKGTAGKVVKEDKPTKGWTKITSGSVTGYVSNDYILVGDEAGEYVKTVCDRVAYVTCDSLRVRKEPTTESKKLASIPKGEKCIVLKTYEGWLKVQVDGDLIGYVSDEYVTVSYDLGKAISIEEERAALEEEKRREEEARKQALANKNNTSNKNNVSNINDANTTKLRKNIVNTALKYVGYPYVHGGNSLTRGTDCSGFTKLIYKQFGYNLARTPGGQIPNGKCISRSQLQPGDLVFYMNSAGTRVGHVAMYIGNNKIVHASNPRDGIKISNMNYRSYYRLVSIIND